MLESVNPNALYHHRDDALAAPGAIYDHFKGGIYRKLGKFIYQEGEFVPQQGDVMVAYEHLYPHEHSLFIRTDKDFRQTVKKPEFGYEGKRFRLVKAGEAEFTHLDLGCDCHAPEHSIKFDVDMEDMDYPYVYVTPYLTTHDNIWKRLVTAFKYVFTNKKGLGQFDNVILREKDLLALKVFVDSAVDKITKRH